MAQFRTKSVVKEAIQWAGENANEIVNFCPDAWREDGSVFLIRTLEGTMRANQGDWIVKGVKGEFYPVKPDIFAETYEPVD